MREDLQFRRVEFVEYDVEQNKNAFARFIELAQGERVVPLLAQDGRVLQIGYEGRGCYANGSS